jgi:hypothetical protein
MGVDASNGWRRYEVHVLEELQRLGNGIQCVDTKLGAMQVEMAEMRASLKVGIRIHGALFGLIGGGVTGLIVAIVTRIMS